jgi:hypothetical protein
MKIMSYFAMLAVGVSLSGCAVDADSDETTNGEGTEQEISAQRKYHYDAMDPSVFWKPGCGIQPPPGHEHACEMGLFVKFTRTFIDLHVDTKVTVNNAAKTITVKLDTWSHNKTHPLTLVALLPQTEPLDESGTQMGVEYKVKVVNYRGATLSTGEVTMMPAP